MPWNVIVYVRQTKFRLSCWGVETIVSLDIIFLGITINIVDCPSLDVGREDCTSARSDCLSSGLCLGVVCTLLNHHDINDLSIGDHCFRLGTNAITRDDNIWDVEEVLTTCLDDDRFNPTIHNEWLQVSVLASNYLHIWAVVIIDDSRTKLSSTLSNLSTNDLASQDGSCSCICCSDALATNNVDEDRRVGQQMTATTIAKQFDKGVTIFNVC